MKYRTFGFVVTAIALGWMGCTPKTASKATKETSKPTPPQPTVNLDSVLADPCRTWQHLPQREELIETHVIYQDYMSMENYDEAFPLWKQVYEAAPMADGKRYTHFKDGITLYRHFLTHDTTGHRTQEYKKNIEDIIHHWIQCASRDSSQLAEQLGQIAFDLYYEYLDVVDHLLVMDHLRSSVGLKGYAQLDPKVEYKREGMKLFDQMWQSIYARTTELIFRVEQLSEDFVGSTWVETKAEHESIDSGLEFQSQQQEAIENTQSEEVRRPIRNVGKRIGRNEPCPCGSGKKYKNCCMRSRVG